MFQCCCHVASLWAAKLGTGLECDVNPAQKGKLANSLNSQICGIFPLSEQTHIWIHWSRPGVCFRLFSQPHCWSLHVNHQTGIHQELCWSNLQMMLLELARVAILHFLNYEENSNSSVRFQWLNVTICFVKAFFRIIYAACAGGRSTYSLPLHVNMING